MSRKSGKIIWTNNKAVAKHIAYVRSKVMPPELRQGMKNIGDVGVKTMREVARVDTGDMQSSISKKIKRLTYEGEVMVGYGVGSEAAESYNVYGGREAPDYTAIAEARWGYTVHRGNSAKRANKKPHNPGQFSAKIASEAMEHELAKATRKLGIATRKGWNSF